MSATQLPGKVGDLVRGSGAQSAANARAALGLGTIATHDTSEFTSSASPAFTGIPTAPTATPGTSTTQLATTAFVAAAVAGVSGAVTSVAGRTGAVTLSVGDVSGAAPLLSPTLTGTPIAPTAAGGTNTTQIATTAFVVAAVAGVSGAVTSVAGRTGAVTLGVADVAGAAPLLSPALTGTPTAPTAAGGTNTTQVATTAFVHAAVAGVGGGGGGSDHRSAQFANVALAPYSADPTNAVAAAAAIQAAHDALLDDRNGHAGLSVLGGTGAGSSNGSSGTVWLPEGSYLIDAPIWLDGDQIVLKGAGRATTTLNSVPGIHPILMGEKRRSAWNRAALDYFNLAGTLTLVHGQAAVVGSGTLFTTQLRPGSKFFLLADGQPSAVQVASIADDAHLTLTAPYAATGGTGGCVTTTSYLATIPVVFAADHRQDAFGVLDTSAASAAGQRWGVTTKSPSSGSVYPDHFLTWWATPPAIGGGSVWGSVGDRWGQTKKLTLSFFVKPPTAAGLPGQATMGMGEPGSPSPWLLTREYDNGNRFNFQFATSADAPGVSRGALFGDMRITGPTRITLQVDMTATDWQSGANCSIRAWVNRREVAVTPNGYGPSFKPSDNLTFATNYNAPFNVGALTYTQVQWYNPELTYTRGDFTLYGLAISNDALYESDVAGVGGNQRFKAAGPFAGQALNDLHQFCGVDQASSLVGCLDTTTPPTADYQGKYVWMQGGPAAQGQRVMGLFAYGAGDVTGGAVGLNEVSGLSVLGWGGMNAGISIGPCLYPTFRDLYCYGNWWGIGSYATSAGVYDVQVRDCRLVGWDAGYYGFSQIAFLENIERVDFGNCALRLSGSEVHVDRIQVGANARPTCDAAIWIDGRGGYSAEYRFKDIGVDIEGSATLAAVVYAERSVSANYMVLDIDGIDGPQLNAGTPLVRLADWNPTTGPTAQFRLAHALMNAPNFLTVGTVVRADSLKWEGEIVDLPSTIGGDFRPVQSGDTSGLSNVRAVLHLDALPTAGTYLKDSVAVVIRHPTGGQARRYDCTTTHTASGTANVGAWTADTGGSSFDPTANVFPDRMTFVPVRGNTSSLANGTNVTGIPFIAPHGGQLTKWKAVAGTNPAGGGFSFDVLKNGVSIFASPRTVAANTTTVQVGTSFGTATFAENDLFTLNISGAGSGVQNVVIQLDYLEGNT